MVHLCAGDQMSPKERQTVINWAVAKEARLTSRAFLMHFRGWLDGRIADVSGQQRDVRCELFLDRIVDRAGMALEAMDACLK